MFHRRNEVCRAQFSVALYCIFLERSTYSEQEEIRSNTLAYDTHPTPAYQRAALGPGEKVVGDCTPGPPLHRSFTRYQKLVNSLNRSILLCLTGGTACSGRRMRMDLKVFPALRFFAPLEEEERVRNSRETHLLVK